MITLTSLAWKGGPTKRAHRFLYLCLADYASETGYCWPSVAALAKRTGQKRRNIFILLPELIESGWVTRKEQGGHAGYQLDLRRLCQSCGKTTEKLSTKETEFIASNGVNFTPVVEAAGVNFTPVPVSFSPSNGVIYDSLYRKNRNEASIEPIDGALALERVKESYEAAGAAQQVDVSIYNAYPRRVGRGLALPAIVKAIARMAKGEGDGETCSASQARTRLLEAVVAYAASPAVRDADMTKIPHPATWFNASRYLDDRTDWQQAGFNGSFNSRGNEVIHRPTLAIDKMRAGA